MPCAELPKRALTRRRDGKKGAQRRGGERLAKHPAVAACAVIASCIRLSRTGRFPDTPGRATTAVTAKPPRVAHRQRRENDGAER